MSIADKSYSWLKALSYILSFHRTLSTPVMSTDVSQVGVALFHSFSSLLSLRLTLGICGKESTEVQIIEN